ncbi:hypothetical protein BT96DRAFT_878919 [Gymnopus androsaceus JB14]|uniref:Uncharacterized protein n=1 Tax=Gymnopus androsaceus JB14 TaxID=1447944 RepID=A0A6A4HZ83_9AGAR|nr:hypothetical protein BT96DRAFT_878919 [Gymnopus androsaceus JB14]
MISCLSAFVLILFASALPVQAAPIRAPNSDNPDSGEITLTQLEAILNGTICSPNNSQFLDECRTAAQALPFVNKAFSDYNITTVGEKAALLSLMAFESEGFQFNVNHFPSPGTPGQGTRNLMEFPFVYQYALSIPFLSTQILALAPSSSDSASASVSISPTTKDAILALVLNDGLSFASAMWFYTQSGTTKTGCLEIPGMVQDLQAQTEKGWENYITQCVGTTVTEGRRQSYLQTLDILNGV